MDTLSEQRLHLRPRDCCDLGGQLLTGLVELVGDPFDPEAVDEEARGDQGDLQRHGRERPQVCDIALGHALRWAEVHDAAAAAAQADEAKAEANAEKITPVLLTKVLREEMDPGP